MDEQMKIENLVFDMGNVLTKLTMDEYIRKHTNSEEEADIIRKQVRNSLEWVWMDRGVMSDEEAISSISARVPESMQETVRVFITGFRMKTEYNLPMTFLVSQLSKDGYGLYLMSNAPRRFHEFRKSLPPIDYMDGIWISSEHGLLKPEPEAYQSFFETMKLEPSSCYFIDDSPANVEAAIRAGMQGCVYHQDPLELMDNLKKAGIVIGRRFFR